MDDSLERDQLNLWEKLNLLYGDESSENAEPEAAGLTSAQPVDESPAEESPESAEKASHGDLGSNALEVVELIPGYKVEQGDPAEVNEICDDCRFDCKQPTGGFVFSRCKLANDSKTENRSATLNQIAASTGLMGIEKINETCRSCRRSCKQRSSKLNRMLCLGFIPIDDGRGERD